MTPFVLDWTPSRGSYGVGRHVSVCGQKHYHIIIICQTIDHDTWAR